MSISSENYKVTFPEGDIVFIFRDISPLSFASFSKIERSKPLEAIPVNGEALFLFGRTFSLKSYLDYNGGDPLSFKTIDILWVPKSPLWIGLT